MSGGIFDKSDLVNGVQASLSDKYLLEIEGLDFALIDSITRPGYKVEVDTLDLMEYKFNFPKKVIFDNTVEFSIVELLDPDIELTQMENVMSRIIDNSFYSTPSTFIDLKPSFLQLNTLNVSKKSLTSAFSRLTNANVEIHTLDAEGRRYESIRLMGAMVTAVKFSPLKSTSSEINKITVTLTFDYVDYGRKGNYDEGTLFSQMRGLFPDIAGSLSKGKVELFKKR